MTETEVTIYTTCPSCGQEMRWSYRSGVCHGEPAEEAVYIGVCEEFFCGRMEIEYSDDFMWDKPEMLYENGISAVMLYNRVPAAEMRTLEAMEEVELADKLHRFVRENVVMK